MAFNAQGTTIARETATPDTFATIGSIRSFQGPGGQAAIIDATTLQSTGKEKVMGLQDEGQLTLECNLDFGTDVTQQGLLADRAAQVLRKFKITFSNAESSTGTFEAFVMGFTISGGVDALTTATIVLEISGSITWVYDPA